MSPDARVLTLLSPMQLPIVAPAPLVTEHAQAFRPLFNDCRQYEHFENYLTGLMVLENKSLANISRCILTSADKTNLSQFLSESPWSPAQVNDTCLEYLLSQTIGLRQPTRDSSLLLLDLVGCVPSQKSMLAFIHIWNAPSTNLGKSALVVWRQSDSFLG